MNPISAHRPVHAIRRDVDELDSLTGSRGWAILDGVLAREEEIVTQALVGNVEVAREVLDFQRSALRAIKLLRDMPYRQIETLKNELELAEAHAGSKEKSDEQSDE